MKNDIRRKITKFILIGLASMVIIVITILGILWNKYVNKNNLLKKYETSRNQEIYLLGTLHEYHFNKWFNYSMQDVLSVVKNVQPDIVFIEAREDIFKEYGVIDGPIDMSVIYSYCIENHIPVEMIDWWVVDNQIKLNSTNEIRDDMIFKNINKKLNNIKEDTKVLVVCGTGHLYEQSKRFLDNGYTNSKVNNKSNLFEDTSKFEYPKDTDKIWERRAYFYAYTYPDIVDQTPGLDDKTKLLFTSGDKDAFYSHQTKYCGFFLNNVLYE